MSFVSKFFNAIQTQENIYHNKYHESIRKNIDYDLIAYYGQRYEMARDLKKSILGQYDHQAVTDMFEEIASKVVEKNYRDIQIDRAIKIWPIENSPSKYRDLNEKEDIKWISHVPRNFRKEFEYFLDTVDWVYEEKENPYDSNSILFYY